MLIGTIGATLLYQADVMIKCFLNVNVGCSIKHCNIIAAACVQMQVLRRADRSDQEECHPSKEDAGTTE